MSVLTYHGGTALTRIPYGAHSTASDLVRWWTAAFDALYAGCHCGRLTMIPDMLPMLTIDPDRRSRMTAPTASEGFHRARTLRSKTCAHCSSVTSNDGAW